MMEALANEDKKNLYPNIPCFPCKLPGSFWAITTFFNPAKYKNKIENYKIFREKSKKQGLNLITVELAFGNEQFELTNSDTDILVQVRSDSILWQKERLLNIALDYLPEDCDKVAWIDCDIVFKNDSWIKEACEVLNRYNVVQLFSFSVRLPEGVKTMLEDFPFGEKDGQKIHSRAYGIFNFGHGGDDFVKNGHTGFAWAIRKSIIKKNRFYDGFILGTSDAFMADCFYNHENEYISKNSSASMKKSQKYWLERMYNDVASSVYYVSGTIFHLWHGTHKDRLYGKLESLYLEYDIDLEKDLKLNKYKCFEWASYKSELQEKIKNYFYIRNEDKKNLYPNIPCFPCKLPGSFWAITTFFNPAKYKNKIENYKIFREKSKKQGLNLITVELAFGNEQFELTNSDTDILVQVRSDSILWQKERLLNIALDYLPEDCDKVAWIDCDIVFKNDSWIKEACEVLNRYNVVQLFSFSVRLPEGVQNFDSIKIDNLSFGYGNGKIVQGFNYSFAFLGEEFIFSKTVQRGTPGFAWAIRKSIILKCNFFDKGILGSGDDVMASAFLGKNFCLDKEKFTEKMIDYQDKWVSEIFSFTKSSSLYIDNVILHLYHGDTKNRGYSNRYDLIKKYNFDPEKDLKLNKYKCFEWTSDKKEFQEKINNYFFDRKEE